MERDTGIGAGGARFPTTRRSAIVAARGADSETRDRALSAIVTAYWKPVYKYLRWKWRRGNEDAKDTTQAFFASMLERRLLDAYDPAKAKFRTYLRVCLDGFVANEDKAARRLKRAPSGGLLSLDYASAEGELALQPASEALGTEEYFEREWIRALFSRAVETLRRECARRGKETAFRLFEIYDLEEEPGSGRPSYETLAARFGLPVTGVTNGLAFARREFRRIVLDDLRDTTGSEEEFRGEARALLGIEPR